MGKQWGNAGKWGYWQGAFSPKSQWQKWGGHKGDGKQNKHGEGQNQQQSEPLFPAYDNKKGGAAKVQTSQSSGSDLLTVVSSTSFENTMIKDLQKLLNVARKSEQKVLKIQQDRTERVRMWKDWERQLKQCYVAERQRHISSLEGLDKDLREAISQQESAREEVRRAATGQAPAQMDIQSGDEIDAQFAALMEEDETAIEELANEDVLRRALQSAAASLTATPPPSKAVPRTPYPGRQTAALQGNSSRVQPFPPPKPLSSVAYPTADLNPLPSPVANQDPYQPPAPSLPAPPAEPKSTSHGKNKTRAALKDAAKPAGPIGRKVLTHSPNRVEELCNQAMKELLAQREGHGGGDISSYAGQHASLSGGAPASAVGQAKHFILEDDDWPEEGQEPAGGQAEMD